MKILLLDVKNDKVEVKEIERKLDVYYNLLDCDLIDIATRQIGGKYYDIICDDEGLWKEESKISAINDLGEPMLVGNLIFCKHDGFGNEIGLEEEDIEHIMGHIQKMYTRKYPDGYRMLTQCEY